MDFLRSLVVISAIIGACYFFGFRRSIESDPPTAGAAAAVVEPEMLSAAEKFTREWFDRHSDRPRDETVAQFMQEADVWAIAYRAQHGLPPLTLRQKEALRDKLCARVRCAG